MKAGHPHRQSADAALGVFGATLFTWARACTMTSISRSVSHDPRPDHKERHSYHPICKGADGARRRTGRGDPRAVQVRFRPVIMTSLAFFFGVLPLAIASGAGAGAMKAIGTAVTGGMLSATFIDLFFIRCSLSLCPACLNAGNRKFPTRFRRRRIEKSLLLPGEGASGGI